MLGYNATFVAALMKLRHVACAGDDYRDCLLAVNVLMFCRGVLCTVSRDECSGALVINAYVLTTSCPVQYAYTLFDRVYVPAPSVTGSWKCIKRRF